MQLADIGFTTEELQDRVIQTIADRLLREHAVYGEPTTDEDGNEVEPGPSVLYNKLTDVIKKSVDATIRQIAETKITPRVEELVESMTLQKTNEWGEKKKAPAMSFAEYLVSRAENYMTEQVDYDGKDKQQAGGYSWTGRQSRITHMIDKHLQYTIGEAMKKVIGDANTTIAKALVETCRAQVELIAANLKVQVTTSK